MEFGGNADFRIISSGVFGYLEGHNPYDEREFMLAAERRQGTFEFQQNVNQRLLYPPRFIAVFSWLPWLGL